MGSELSIGEAFLLCSMKRSRDDTNIFPAIWSNEVQVIDEDMISRYKDRMSIYVRLVSQFVVRN